MKDVAGAALAATAANAAHGDSLTAPLTQTFLGAQEPPLEWKNWSGSVTCTPRAIERPTSEEEVVDIVRRANAGGYSVRLTGTGHSFMPLCATDGVVVSLAEMSGVVNTDLDALEATVLGGTKLQQMHEPLRAAGMAMENISDIDRQAIAGAIATSTHGTGKGIRTISNQVVGLRMVIASGDVIECSPELAPETFKAAQVSLGALGIVTQVRMRLMPTYRLHQKTWNTSFDECFANLQQLIQENRHFEFFWVSGRDLCAMKTLNITEEMPNDLPDVKGERIDHSDVIFPSIRSRRFNEIEFSVPEENGPDCLLELRQLLLKQYPEVTMPLEYRTVGADDIPLSMAQGRETVTISAHQIGSLPYEKFFGDVESIFRNHRGRPHWGKIHTHTPAELKNLYPKWEDFQTERRRLDPKGRFMNYHLSEIFG